MKSKRRIINSIACLLWAAFAASGVASRAFEEKSTNSEPRPSAPPPPPAGDICYLVTSTLSSILNTIGMHCSQKTTLIDSRKLLPIELIR